MSDPLTEIVGLLRPSAAASKFVTASGRWAVRRTEAGLPFYAAVLEGSCRLTVDGREPVVLAAGDFCLIPAARGFVMGSLASPGRGGVAGPVEVGPGVFRIGPEDAAPEVRAIVGHGRFGSDDAGLLVSLLPEVVHVRGEGRLLTLVELVAGEAQGGRPGREAVLSRLLEVLMIEALRTGAGPAAAPGLLRGLGDARLAGALRRMHADPARGWQVDELAREAGLSRSAFFERFRREVGVAPMAYLQGWRMTLAKDLLRREGAGVAEVAERVGYGSGSTFSAAFARGVGRAPRVYARGVGGG